jgi:hypothetical protein
MATTAAVNTTPAAYSIREFCIAHRISEAKYFTMKLQGDGPIEMRIGRRRLISHESAQRWRYEREAADRAADAAIKAARAEREGAAEAAEAGTAASAAASTSSTNAT